MVTVVQRPTGHKIIDQAITAEIIEDYSGDAWVLFPSHGLATGATVYIVSDIDEYNGFWYVTVTNGSSFKISEGVGTDFVLFYQEVDIEYYQTQEHDWNSIFLPIVYKISNDRWPVNTIDSVTLIVSNADDNGFTSITTVAPLKTGVNALEFLEISNASTTEANGVWQIVEVNISNVYVINLPYELSGSLVGATVQYYYNNYQVKVKVFAGLPATHPWEIHKTYTEVAELSLTPDDNNLVMFSIADYIKMKVAIKNNLTLFSLPLNLDAFTGFYISTAESYDYSDSYSLLTQESSFAIDSFEGYAIAGKLEFKNVYAGDYADFIYTSGSPARWLTNRSRLLSVEGYYFDVSFIKNITGDFFVRFNWYVSDYLTLTEDIQFSDQGIGVYRIPVTANSNYDSVCLQAFKAAVPGTPGSPETEDLLEDFPPMEDWFNQGTGGDWTVSNTPTYTSTGNTNSKEYRSNTISLGLYNFVAGESYRMVAAYTKVYSSGTELIRQLILSANDSVGAPQFQTTHNPATGNTSGEVELSFVATSAVKGAELQYNNSSGDEFVITIDTFEVYHIIPAVPPGESQPAFAITEEICIDILEACDVQDGFVSTEGIRLLEDGGYRLLE